MQAPGVVAVVRWENKGARLGVAVVTAALVAPCGAAVAAPEPTATWEPVIDLAQSRSVSRPDVVVDRAGTTTVVVRVGRAVLAIRRDAAGVWGDPHRLGRGRAPQAGVGADGTVATVWTRRLPGRGPQVMAAQRFPSGRWTKPFAVSAPIASEGSSAHGAFGAKLAVSNDGALLVSWLWGADDSGASRVQVRYRPAGGGWHRIATLSPVEARSPVCAIADNGRAVVVYTVFARAYAVLLSSHGWGRRHEVGQHVEPPQVAMADTGDVVAVWSALETDGTFRPQAVTRRVGHRWTAPRTLDPALVAAGSSEPVVASSRRGHATVAWIGSDDGVWVADHPRRGPWSAATEVAPSGDPAVEDPPHVDATTGRSGDVLLSWTRRDARGRYVEAAYRPARRGWQLPLRVSPTEVSAASAKAFVTTDGAVAVWRGYDADRAAHLQLRILTRARD